jgi:hypothetical protein
MSYNNFQVGDLIIHHQRDEIAIVVGEPAPLKGKGYLEVITIYDVGCFPCSFIKSIRTAAVWDHFTEETPVITK